MPTVALCPKCGQPVALPTPIEAASAVRCPLCRAEYQLQEALEFAPPALELIQQVARPSAVVVSSPKAASSVVTGTPASAGNSSIPDLLISTAGGYITRPEGEFLSATAQDMPASGGEVRSAQAVAPRRRRKQQNFAVDFLKIVAGGLAGLAIGYAILLWGFKVDPFKLARRLPSALVPEQVQSPDSRPLETTDTPSPDPPIQPAPQSTGSLPALPEPSLATQEPETESTGPKIERSYSLGDVSRSLRGAREAADALQAALDEPVEVEPSALKPIRRQFYVKLAELAEAVTLSRDHPRDAQTVRSLAISQVLSVADDRSKLVELGRLAGAWIDSSTRSSSGVVLVGTVQKVEAAGKYFRTDVRLPARDLAVAVLSGEMPNLSPNESVLMLGVIVSDPRKALSGYEGPNETIVWSSISEQLAAAPDH